MAGSPSLPETDSADITGRYLELSTKSNNVFPEELKGYKILFVPGFLSNLYDLSHTGMARQLYFSAQIEDLRTNGLDAELASTSGVGLPAENAKIIQEAVSASTMPVIIVAHSKGGIDSLEALISYTPMRRKVKGLVAIQTPFFGSEIADAILKRESFSEKAGDLMKKLGGNRETLSSLGTKTRKDYYGKRKGEIDRVASSIPVLSFATRLNKATPLKPLGDYLRGKGLESDGLVPVRSAMLPGAKRVIVDGSDHAMTVFRVPYGNMDRIAMTRTLLRMELELIKANNPPALTGSRP